MTTDEIVEELLASEEAVLLPEDYRSALIGVGYRFNSGPLAVYSLNMILEILTSDGTSMEDALDWYQYNMVGAWVGDGTPIFVDM
jgi:hypothetical protein